MNLDDFWITALYAGLLGLVMAALSIRVPLRRGALNIPWGDGGDVRLATYIRTFGNFIEYVPMILLLMLLLELANAGAGLLHGLGAALIAARLVHALTLHGGPDPRWYHMAGRGFGAFVTWLVLLTAASALVYAVCGPGFTAAAG